MPKDTKHQLNRMLIKMGVFQQFKADFYENLESRLLRGLTARICVVRDFKAPTYQTTLPFINYYIVHI